MLKHDERVQHWLGAYLSKKVSRTQPSISIGHHKLYVDKESIFTVSVLSSESRGEGRTIKFGDSTMLHSKDKINLFDSAGGLVLRLIYLREDRPEGVLEEYDSYQMGFKRSNTEYNPYIVTSRWAE